jgi:hypothetical protein
MGDIMRKYMQTLKKIRKMPVSVVAKKANQKVKQKAYHLYRRHTINFFPIDTSIGIFLNFKTDSQPLFNKNKDFYSKEIVSLQKKEQIIQDANKICNHMFDLLGSGNVNLGSSIAWNKDFKTGFIWENRFYKDIKVVDITNNSDVKVPWELSRFQHLFTLGKAYWLTNNEKYAVEFKEEIEGWIKDNPVENSVNWTCAMEVAIRAVNWINGYYFFKDSPSISKEFWLIFNKSLYFHGYFIIRNLENGTHTGNHYLSDIVGLAWLGLYFNGLHVTSKRQINQPHFWLDFAIEELKREMFIEVNEDGTNYESSTAYHRLVTELFLITTIFLEKNNKELPIPYKKRLEKMCEFIMDITKPNGTAPLIGDADNGRFIILSNWSNLVNVDFSHLLYIAGEYYNRNDFRYFGRRFKEDALWVIGEYENLQLYEPKLISKGYQQGGYYILRNELFHCVVRCGELSFRGLGDHSHNDQLSFELNIRDKDFIVDPGTYMYTGDANMRNLFRSTKFHNTIQIEKKEQNHFNPKELFFMKEQTKSQCKEFTEETFVGEHYGYVEKTGHVHRRTIHIQDRMCIIKDSLDGSVVSDVQFILNLSPEVQVFPEHNNTLYLISGEIKIRIQGLKNIQVEKGFVSNSFGTKVESFRIISSVDLNYSEIIIEVI